MKGAATTAAVLAAMVLAACGGADNAAVKAAAAGAPPASAGPALEQSSLCEFANVVEAVQCRDGQLMFFAPNTWGNDQLPLTAAAVYCDWNHQVIHTKGGVVCVFTSARIRAAAEQAKQESQGAGSKKPDEAPPR